MYSCFIVTQVYISCSTPCPIPVFCYAQRWIPWLRALLLNLGGFIYVHDPRPKTLHCLTLTFPNLAMIALVYMPKHVRSRAAIV